MIIGLKKLESHESCWLLKAWVDFQVKKKRRRRKINLFWFQRENRDFCLIFFIYKRKWNFIFHPEMKDNSWVLASNKHGKRWVVSLNMKKSVDSIGFFIRSTVWLSELSECLLFHGKLLEPNWKGFKHFDAFHDFHFAIGNYSYPFLGQPLQSIFWNLMFHSFNVNISLVNERIQKETVLWQNCKPNDFKCREKH